MGETCDRDECFCCGKGHWCEPDRYPDALGETWTCPECGREHHSYDPRADDRLPEFARSHIPAGVYGWRSPSQPTDPRDLTDPSQGESHE